MQQAKLLKPTVLVVRARKQGLIIPELLTTGAECSQSISLIGSTVRSNACDEDSCSQSHWPVIRHTPSVYSFVCVKHTCLALRQEGDPEQARIEEHSSNKQPLQQSEENLGGGR
jgi:hypothetical protein